MRAIPTRYRGIQMRSRLEAKWAFVFDQLGWKWEYEPFDLAGWIPDFALELPRDKTLLVEVKPIMRRSEEVCKKIECGLGDESYDVLLCGANITTTTIKNEKIYGIGWLYTENCWNTSALVNNDFADWNVIRAKDFFEWRDSLDDTYAGVGTILHYWRDATNALQWRAPR